MLDSLGAIKELYEASKGGEVLAAINHAAKMTTTATPFTGFSRSQIRVMAYLSESLLRGSRQGLSLLSPKQ